MVAFASDPNRSNDKQPQEPSFKPAHDFLEALAPSETVFDFRTFDDNKARRDRHLTRKLRGTLDGLWPELKRLNGLGAGIFVSVNATDGKGVKAENITKLRAVWHDDDACGNDLGNLPLPPSLIARTSTGKYHRYWFADDLGPDQFKAIMQCMVKVHGSDKGATDTARVLRLPGTMHMKGEPQLVEILKDTGTRYSGEQLSKHFPAPVKPEGAPEARAGNSTPSFATDHRRRDIEAALAVIPADDYQTWISIGMALKSEFGDSGFTFWEAWSQKSAKYQAGEPFRKWRSFDEDGGIKGNTIFHIAKEYGWKLPREDEAELEALGNIICANFNRPEVGITAPSEEEEAGSADYGAFFDDFCCIDMHLCGGLLAQIRDWILITSPVKPNPNLALAAAISIIGTVCGRHISGPTHCGTNLYIIGIGRTGVGKDRPLKAVDQILSACDLDHIVKGSFKSDVALEMQLSRTPGMIAVIDEIGQNLFSRFTTKKASSHEANISSMLRTLWSIGFGAYNTVASKERAHAKIKNPSLSLFGMTTEDEFYNSLSGGQGDNGLLNRLLIIRASPKKKENPDANPLAPVPGSMIAAVRGILPEGNLSNALAFTADNISQLKIDWENEEAKAVYEVFRDGLEDAIDQESSLKAAAGRAAETAVRLATICAVSELGREARVGVKHIKWGISIAAQAAKTLHEEVGQRISETEFQRRVNAVQAAIPFHEEVQHSTLLKRLKNQYSAREIKDAIEILIDGNVLVSKQTGPGRNGKSTAFYARKRNVETWASKIS